MSALRTLIEEAIRAATKEFSATVLTNPEMIQFDLNGPEGAPSWVVTVDAGGNRVMKNVPVKAGSDGSRFYAQRGQTVTVRKTAQGRFQVIGPGDRQIGAIRTTFYDIGLDTETGQSTVGFSRIEFPMEFHMGPLSMKGAPNVTFAVEGGFDSITRDDVSASDFVSEGFVSGQSIIVETTGTAIVVNGTYTIEVVTASQITVSETLLNVGPIRAVTIGVALSAFWNDGIHFTPYFEIHDGDGIPIVL